MRIIHHLQTAYRTQPPFGKSRGNSLATKAGLAYERKVVKEFSKLDGILSIEHNPWFGFADGSGGGLASPDLLAFHKSGILYVVEVKLTWTTEAVSQLIDFYIPILGLLGNQHEFCKPNQCCTGLIPLIITKNLTKDSPPAELKISSATQRAPSLLHWFGNGGLQW